MTDVLADWYFTRCVNLPAGEDQRLLDDLQRLRLVTLAPLRLIETVDRLAGADPRARAYALPSLVTIAMRPGDQQVREVAAEAVAAIAAASLGGTLRTSIVDLAERLIGPLDLSGPGADLLEPLEALAATALNLTVVKENTPYFGITSQAPQVLILSVARELASASAYRAAVSERLVSCLGEEPDGAIASLLLRCAYGEFGRLPLLVAAQLLSAAGQPRRALDLLAAAHHGVEPRACSYEPDLVVTASSTQILTDGSEAVVRQKGLERFVGEPSDRAPSAGSLRRLGITAEEAPVLRAVVWQLGQLVRGIRGNELTADQLRTIFAPRATASERCLVTTGSRPWIRMAERLAEVSGVKANLEVARNKQQAASIGAVAHLVAGPWPVGRMQGEDLKYPGLDSCAGILRLCRSVIAVAERASRPGSVADDALAGLLPLLFFAEVELATGPARRRTGPGAWVSLVLATLTTVAEITSGHVGAVSPEDLVGWVEQAVGQIDASLAGSAVAARIGDKVDERPLTWALVAAPRLDEVAGPGRWGPMMKDIIDADIDYNEAAGVTATVLNDILRRLALPSHPSSGQTTTSWSELDHEGSPAAHDILLSVTEHYDEWCAEPHGNLSNAARAALAIRRLEAVPPSDDVLAQRAYREVADAMAAFLRTGRDDFYVLVRAVSLLAHPSVRSSADRAEQVAGLALAAEEPLQWDYMFRQLTDADPDIVWRVLGAGLRRLIGMARLTSTTERLRRVWRSALARAIESMPLAGRAARLDQLAAEADLAGGYLAATDAAPVAMVASDLDRRRLDPAGPNAAGATWLTRALVLDPVHEAHGAWLATLDASGVGRRFAPRQHHSIAAVIAVGDDHTTARVNIGESGLVAAIVNGTARPNVGDLVRLTTTDEKRSIALFPPRVIPGRITTAIVEEKPIGLGRKLVLQAHVGQMREDLDVRLWDADTARAYHLDDSRMRVAAINDPDLGWIPVLRDGLALVMVLAATGGPVTVVYNGPCDDGWVLSGAPGESYGLRRSDLTTEAATLLDEQLAGWVDPNGLLITFGLASGLLIDLYSGTHATSIHGDVTCPIDDRNLRWRSVVDEHRDGVLLAKANGEWRLPVRPPAFPFPDHLLLDVDVEDRQDRRAVDSGQKVIVSPEPFSAEAQRAGRLSARVERVFTMAGAPAELFDQLVHATQPVTVRLKRILGQRDPGGSVRCATEPGYAVNLNPDQLTLLPLRDNELRELKVEGWMVVLRPPRPDRGDGWIRLPHATAESLSMYLSDACPALDGIVWSRRRDSTGGTTVTVRLDLATDGFPEVAVDFGPQAQAGHVVRFRRGPGTGVVEARIDKTPHFAVRIQAPLQFRAPVEGAIAVGRVPSRGARAAEVVQAPDGTLHLVPEQDELALFAKYSEGSWVPPGAAWTDGWRLDRATSGERDEWVVVTKTAATLSGWVRQCRLERGAAVVRGANITVRHQAGGVTLSRDLLVANVLRQRSSTALSRPPRPDTERVGLDVSVELGRLWAAGEPVDIELDGRDQNRAQVLELVQLGASRREASLAVLDESPALVSAANYERSGIALIVPLGEHQYGVSFRDVPDLKIADYAALLGAGMDHVVRPPRLFYAKEMDGHHVLEFGFGLRVAAEERWFRFDGGPFDRARGVLFHGDQIEEIIFRDTEDGMVLDVVSASVRASVGTSLYQQAARLHFLHLLSVETDGQRLHVREIEGFSRKADLGARSVFAGPPIERASLHEDDANELLADLMPGERRVVYGQLDTNLFVTSAGLTLRFSRRTLTAEGITAIGTKVVTFLNAGQIRSSAVEIGLEVRSASSRPDDLAENLAVIRRNFSVDVNQLGRLARLKGDGVLAGSLVVAALAPEEKRGVSVKLADRSIPDRQNTSLRDLCEEDGLFLLVDSVQPGREGPTVRLEFRFGIYFSLRPEEIDAISPDLDARDVVRATWSSDSGRFTLTRCVPSDRRFFEERPRPLIALPTNPLLAKRAMSDTQGPRGWSGAGFVAGGLPGEVAFAAGLTRSGAWSAPRAEELVELMRQPHPRVAMFGVSRGSLRMAPAVGSAGAGTVSFGQGRVGVEIDGSLRVVDPAVLTFGDESARAVAARAAKVSWRFHDERTGHWTDTGVQRTDLPAHSLTNGRVFFESGDRLRYTADLHRWSYPSTFLTQGIHGGPRLRCAVAGHSIDATGQVDGLYIEVVPGVICLVLGTLLGLAQGDGRATILEGVSLSSFCVGDILGLEIGSDPERSVDSVVLVDWYPSGRGLGGVYDRGGNNQLVAPVIDFDPIEGRLRLGAGQVIVEVPTYREPPASVVMLSQANDVVAYSGSVRTGDAALIVIEDHRLAVAGMPGVQLRAVRRQDASDPCHAHLFDDDGRLIPSRLKAEVAGAGGALVVTIDHLDREGGFLRFTFRRQAQILSDTRTLVGQVVGSDGEDLLVRSGAAVIRIPADRAVAGIPSAAIPVAADALRTYRTILWLEDSAAGKVGRSPAASGVGRFVAEVDVDSEDVAGLIVRETDSHALVWLPSSELALATLTSRDRRALWMRGRRPVFQALLLERGHASILAHPAVRKERSTMRLGSTLGVTVRAKVHREDADVLLVETRSGAILELHSGRPPVMADGDQLTVEIQSIGTAGAVVAVPVGERQIALQIPHRLFASLPAIGEHRPAYGAFVAALTGQSSGQGHESDDDLAQAWVAVSAGRPSAQGAADAAAWWTRLQPDAEVDLLPMLVSATVLLAASVTPLEALAEDGAVDVTVLPESRRKWRQLSSELLASLGRRSIRSLHVEVLMRYWLKQRHRHEGLAWSRFELMASTLGRPVPATWSEAAEPVLRHLELGGGREGRLTSAAVRVAGGAVAAAGRLLSDEDLILPEVIRAVRVGNPSLLSDDSARPFRPPAREVARLQQAILSRIIGRLCAEGDDIILLADPPWFA